MILSFKQNDILKKLILIKQKILPFKLSIDLIPKNTFKINLRSRNYNKYKIISKYLKEKHQFCKYCHSKDNLESDEVWFNEINEKQNIQFHTLIEMQIICRKCHLAKHFGYASLTKTNETIALKQLQLVNKKNYDEILSHIKNSFQIWHIKNKFEWKVNTDSYINQFTFQ